MSKKKDNFKLDYKETQNPIKGFEYYGGMYNRLTVDFDKDRNQFVFNPADSNNQGFVEYKDMQEFIDTLQKLLDDHY